MESGLLIDVAGWVGAAFLLLAYVLVSTKRTEGDSIIYQLLNMVGGALLIINSLYYGAYPSVGVNVLWIGIAVYALGKRRAKPQTNNQY